MQLKDKLGELVATGQVRLGTAGLSDQPRRVKHGIERVVAGTSVDTAYGPAYVAETRYGADGEHGGVSLGEARTVPGRLLADLGLDAGLVGLDLSRSVFLDTETTGLGLGAGTYVFLVGLACFEGEDLLVRQFFLRDFNEEPAFLAAVEDHLKRFDSLVTFNGKAFDLPLLENRYILARRRPRLPDAAHLDLRHASARLWRERLASCSLASLEQGILGFARENDVPGELIPLLYFDYLRTGDARIVEPVFTHNRHDLLSLLALTIKAARLVADPLGGAVDDPADRFSLARLLERLGRTEESLACYEMALAGPLPEATRERAARRLACLYKRVGQRGRAVDIWLTLVAETGWTVYPHIELAKYYEHQVRDYDRAIEAVREGLARLSLRSRAAGPRSAPDDDPEYVALRHRLRRLEGKRSRRSG
ncbi:MAG TPA: ribonuclease H-like domain-containing protein [Bacillota bacterium]